MQLAAPIKNPTAHGILPSQAFIAVFLPLADPQESRWLTYYAPCPWAVDSKVCAVNLF